MKLLTFPLLLCTIYLLMDMFSVQVNGQVYTCCRKTYNNNVKVNRLASYYMQNTNMCPIKAVTFVTISGKKLCSDPTNDWAKLAMNHLDQKKKLRIHPKPEASPRHR